MDRRKILLGSGTVFTTVLAGCSSIDASRDGDSDDRNEHKADDSETDHETDESTDDKDHEKDEKEDKSKDDDKDHKKEEKKDVPSFDRDAFNIDSDLIDIKELEYHKGKLTVGVILRTNDRDLLAEELRYLAPGFADAVRDSDAFLADLEELKFTLFDEHKNRVFAFFLDVEWLRKLLSGDITNDEFVQRILELMEDF